MVIKYKFIEMYIIEKNIISDSQNRFMIGRSCQMNVHALNEMQKYGASY